MTCCRNERQDAEGGAPVLDVLHRYSGKFPTATRLGPQRLQRQQKPPYLSSLRPTEVRPRSPNEDTTRANVVPKARDTQRTARQQARRRRSRSCSASTLRKLRAAGFVSRRAPSAKSISTGRKSALAAMSAVRGAIELLKALQHSLHTGWVPLPPCAGGVSCRFNSRAMAFDETRPFAPEVCELSKPEWVVSPPLPFERKWHFCAGALIFVRKGGRLQKSHSYYPYGCLGTVYYPDLPHNRFNV